MGAASPASPLSLSHSKRAYDGCAMSARATRARCYWLRIARWTGRCGCRVLSALQVPGFTGPFIFKPRNTYLTTSELNEQEIRKSPLRSPRESGH